MRAGVRRAAGGSAVNPRLASSVKSSSPRGPRLRRSESPRGVVWLPASEDRCTRSHQGSLGGAGMRMQAWSEAGGHRGQQGDGAGPQPRSAAVALAEGLERSNGFGEGCYRSPSCDAVRRACQRADRSEADRGRASARSSSRRRREVTPSRARRYLTWLRCRAAFGARRPAPRA